MSYRQDDPRLDRLDAIANAAADKHGPVRLDAADRAAMISALQSLGVKEPRPGVAWSDPLVSDAYLAGFYRSHGKPTEPRTDAAPASTDRPIERAAHREMIERMDAIHDQHAGHASGLKSDGTEAGARAKMIAAHDLRPDPHAGRKGGR